MHRKLLQALFGILLASGAASADPPSETAPPPCAPAVLLDPSIDDPHHTMERAGCPQKIACYAQPSESKDFIGYPVGGGCPLHLCGDYPCPTEGTWGWDYEGCLLPRRVFLYWWHKCYQGGTGAYKTDGPQLHCSQH